VRQAGFGFIIVEGRGHSRPLWTSSRNRRSRLADGLLVVVSKRR
jgi:hypothetical protein